MAPVVEAGAAKWPVYLPEGAWVDVWTGKAVAGAQVISRPVPLTVIPVYCRVETWEAMRATFAA